MESLRIEGIHRTPTDNEVMATQDFLHLKKITRQSLLTLQEVYAPSKPLRTRQGMDVRVGNYVAPRGGCQMTVNLRNIIDGANTEKNSPWRLKPASPWDVHVAFEKLHPFMDGNGRTGRTLWAWCMLRDKLDPFSLPFLHRFYYQTLEHS